MTTTYTPLCTLGAGLLLFFGACASRSVPDEFPSGSAASTSAAEGTVPAVSTAVEQDPPLPGEDSARWPGLESEAEPGAAGHAHGAHHDHAHEHGSHAPSAAKQDGAEKRAAEAGAYVCPMHPEETASEADARCGKCGMNLVPRP